MAPDLDLRGRASRRRRVANILSPRCIRIWNREGLSTAARGR
ncbi:unnamed protein product [Linum tenue]|uniref:Uncharacterized protein n=1 Tax=Linum tenue TaxID=586396 RepID=A0AAV0LPC8_9ROSI|nr:unnamed protein product [Linum tenue]